MISIITAIHNQLPMNRLYWEYLERYTTVPFELIIIDNISTDGSLEYFQSLAKEHDNVTVIANEGNYSYPHCQNLGISVAKYDTLAFLNNDILLSKNWDTRVLKMIGVNGFHILSLSSTDRLADKKHSKQLQHRWKRIKYPIRAIFDQRGFSLKLMTKLCFGSWERFTEGVYAKYGDTLSYGFSGSAIIMDRVGVEKLGSWDITQQGADYDIMTTSLKRHISNGDIKPCAILNGVFHHHFRRVSAKCSYPPFEDRDNLISLEQKWREESEYVQLCMDITKFRKAVGTFPIEEAPQLNFATI